MIEVFSSGGGTQSTCIAALIVQGRLPKPDFMVIADTGRECSSTWEYLDAVIRPAMATVGVEVHRLNLESWGRKRYQNEFAYGNLLVPAFTMQSGEIGKLPGFCSSKWKVDSINRFLLAQGIRRKDYKKWIGFSLDEWRRVQRMACGEEYRNGLIRFPLVHDVPLQRHEAIREVERMGWPTPPRSRCWMCPNQKDDQWFSLSADDFAKAVTKEKEIRGTNPHVWLHKSCTPLDEVDFSPEPTLFDSGDYCSSGACFV